MSEPVLETYGGECGDREQARRLVDALVAELDATCCSHGCEGRLLAYYALRDYLRDWKEAARLRTRRGRRRP